MKLRSRSVVVALLSLSAACTGARTDSATAGQPWPAASTVQPADLVRELASAAAPDKPVVAYVGPAFLYRQGHIPGASLHGAASTAEGLKELKSWAGTLPRSANLVIYCGCCPLADCPNLRPAFAALQPMGFTRLRVLILPDNFATDWAGKGYPVERQGATP